MAMQKYRGGSMIDDMVPQSFSSMLDRFFTDSVNTRSMAANFSPRVDTCETENGFEIEMALPGLKQDEIHIDFQEGRLTISGERKFTQETKDKKYHLIENQYGSFSRSFYLPDIINPENIEAELADGVLRVLVPKDIRKTQKHQIQVKSSAVKPEAKKRTEDEKASDKGQKVKTEYHQN